MLSRDIRHQLSAGSTYVRRITLALLAALALLALLPHATPARAHLVEQVQVAGGSSSDTGHGIAVDAAGNRYITGSFQERATFGSGSNAVSLTSRGHDDAFVAKYDGSGALLWARQVSGSVTDQGREVAVAADGSVYVTGLFTAGVEFIGSGIKLSSRGAGDSFVARYNPNGQLIWALRAGGTAGDIGLGLAVEGNGNAVVTGNFSGQATFADIDSPAAATLTSAGRIDGFVTKYDPQGQLLWARRAGGSGNDSGRGIAVDSAGAVYVSGSFSALASFPSPGSSAELSSAGAEDLFVARYSPDGNLSWAQRAGGASTDRALAITVDQQQNGYLTGFFTTEATFGTLSLEGQGKEIFLAKLSPDGAFLQAKSAGGAGVDEGRGIARDAQGTTYLTGTYQDTALFGEAGRLRELRQPTRAEIDPNVAIFIAAYDANFLPTFVEGAGGDADLLDQSGNDIAVDAAGRAHVTGVAKPTSIFGVGNGIVAPSPIRGSDAFLAIYATGMPREVFYLSSSSGGTVDGIGFADEDVLAYDPANNKWSVLIDGSDIGLEGVDIDAFEWHDGSNLFMSFDSPITLPGIPFEVDDSDIVRFIPTQLGATTSGRFELFFDGSNVGLTTDAEDVDAIGFRSDGRLMISTIGPARVPGIGGEFNAGDEDVLLFSATSLGETTSGSWELFYDGSLDSLGDDPAEGIDALWFQPGGEDFVFGTGAPVKMFGVQFGDGADLFRCNQFVREGQRHCGPNIFLDSSSKGFFGEAVDAFSVGDSGVLGDIGDGDDTEPGPPEDPDDAPNDLSSVFLPLVSR